MIVIKSPREIEVMREAGRLTAQTIEELKKLVAPGITTRELDESAARFIRAAGAVPGFLGYQGFPRNICASVNEQVVHGIPGSRRLKPGDIISLDIGVMHRGYWGDAAVTLPVGEVSPEARRLMQVTEASLYAGLEKVRPEARLTDIGNAVQSYVESHGFSVVREFVGHGIGQKMHEEPQIPNFGPPGKGPVLKPGMVLAIEPMVNTGTYHVKVLSDNWTVVTRDGKPSAHFEHTVAVGEDGPIILTLP